MRHPASIRLDDAIALARSRHASDVHLETELPPILRVDGSLERSQEPALCAEETRDLAAVLLSAQERALLETDGDVTTMWTHPVAGRIRAHVYASRNGLTIAIRLLQREVPSLETLRLPSAVSALTRQEHGIVILAGPTGSGKTTTLAALVDAINTESARRIVTLEDPIEYQHTSRRSLVTQREIGRDTPSLAAALRGALRSDPDIIVVGEMRDAEAMLGALTAAETGHLVMTTLHTGTAAQTVDRIVDSFSGGLQSQVRSQLAQTLLAIACQHLVRRSAGTGRRAAVEMLVGTDAVRAMIRDSKAHQLKNAMATGRNAGMQTLEQHLTDMLVRGEIGAAEAARFGVRADGRAVA